MQAPRETLSSIARSSHPSLSQTIHYLILETGLDETLECSWVSFSFGNENQTRIPQISLAVGCWDFSTHLEDRLCCNPCALSLTGFSFSAHHFLLTISSQKQLRVVTILPYSLHLVFLLFCHSAISQSLVLEKNLLHLTPQTALHSQISIQQSTWQPRAGFCTNKSWAATSQGTCPAGHSGSATGTW